MKEVKVIGAGLAGCEATWQLANRGCTVHLYEMKPQKKSPAHHSDSFSELVCSNSLRADRIQNAVGLLKEEMRCLDSIIIQSADAHRVPAGGALAVDRAGFAEAVTRAMSQHPNIIIHQEEVTSIPNEPTIIATGPLTDGLFAQSIETLMGDSLFFFDAAAPILTYESLNMDKVFRASRYGKGNGDDYLNCPMNREQYFQFVHALVEAETADLHDFEKKMVFEGCMPVEVMASRGEMTLAFGPMKPVGLQDERTEEKPFAVVQLRQDNAEGTLYNMVGFQTHLKFPEQKRVFSMIPGLKNAVFARYGVMHRNTFLQSPQKLNANYEMISKPTIFFAGQITGVEGYVESASSGLVAGISLANQLMNKPMPVFSTRTAHGALANYVAHYAGKNFQPMNISFGLMEAWSIKVRDKQERYSLIAERALTEIKEMDL